MKDFFGAGGRSFRSAGWGDPGLDKDLDFPHDESGGNLMKLGTRVLAAVLALVLVGPAAAQFGLDYRSELKVGNCTIRANGDCSNTIMKDA
ncbi:MAG: hypothetical protein FJX47_08065, partial [Alphaproteobacteria bacterium]|nr:hypothetical protein [Alphaproteobacteria bacterium]